MPATVVSTLFVTGGSQIITVPVGAQGVVAIARDFGNAGSTLDSISLDGAGAFSVNKTLAASASYSGSRATALATAIVNTTGSNLFTVVFTDPAVEQATALVFVAGINPNDWVRETLLANAAGFNSAVAAQVITSTATDLVIACQIRDSANPATVASWTSFATRTTGTARMRVSRRTLPGSASTSFTPSATAPDCDTAAVISIKAGPEPSSIFLKQKNFRAHMAQ